MALPRAGQPAADPIPVAVMRVRAGSVAAEADVLLGLGRHPHLVRFFGMCRDGEEDLMVTELAPEGSLSDLMTRLDEQEEPTSIPAAHKLAILQQVASGMTALADVKLFHRDLAARNVLVFSYDGSNVARTLVKVSDFGLAVNGHTATHRYVEGRDRPTRYLPPEALQRGRYSKKSDVWAFGVLAWELYTDGQIPYFAVVDDEAIIERVCGGHRLARPTEGGGCTDGLWRVVTSCWEERPNARPSFAQLTVLLGQVGPAAVQAPRRDGDGIGGDAPAGVALVARAGMAGPAPLPPAPPGDDEYKAGLDALEGCRGVPRDAVRARQLFEVAADHGHTRARGELGRMLLYGEGGRIDYREAARVLQLAVDNGDDDACRYLASMYFFG